MKQKQYEELGKGLINLGNLVGGFSIINGLFGNNHNLEVGVSVFLIMYIVFGAYISGILIIGKGETDD